MKFDLPKKAFSIRKICPKDPEREKAPDTKRMNLLEASRLLSVRLWQGFFEQFSAVEMADSSIEALPLRKCK